MAEKISGIRAMARKIMLGFSITAATLAGAPAANATSHHYRHSHATLHHLHLQTTSFHHHSYGHHVLHHHVYGGELAFYHTGLYRGHRTHYGYRLHHLRYLTRYRYSGLQCVPYAREVSHIDLSGNAFLWWAEAAGRYARGSVPEEGAVLNFRGIGRMPLGHVAVVTDVIDSRTILVTQANWVRGTITNDVQMQDVSPNNDWTQVQVELGDSSTWGAAYPTYGFIYNQPATTTTIAGNTQSNEVAEAPTPTPINFDAPNRNLQ